MDGATEVLYQYGLAGVVIFALALTVVALYRDNKVLSDRILAEKDARRADAKETLEKVTEPLQSISQTTSYILDKLVVSKRRGGNQ